jgi:hypothetical protein
MFGEFLGNAQGEDIVAGVRTPISIAEFAQKMPEAYKSFARSPRSLSITFGMRRILNLQLRTRSYSCYRHARQNGALLLLHA